MIVDTIVEEVNMEKKTKMFALAGVAGLIALGMLGKGSSDTSTGTGGGGGIAPFADMLQFGGEVGSKKDASVSPVGGTGGHTFNLPAMEPITFGGGGWGEPTPTFTPKKTTMRSVLTSVEAGQPTPKGASLGQRWQADFHRSLISETKKARSAPSPSVVRKADSFETGRAGGTWLRSGATKGIKKSWAAHQEKRQFQWGFLKGAAGR